MARVERPFFFLDLRQPKHKSDLGVVAERRDALVYVDRMTRARPIGRWLGLSDLPRASPTPR